MHFPPAKKFNCEIKNNKNNYIKKKKEFQSIQHFTIGIFRGIKTRIYIVGVYLQLPPD